MIKNGTDLFDLYSGKPLDKLRHERAVLEILKERRDRHSGAAKHPGAAHALGIALNGGQVDQSIICAMLPLAPG